MEDNLNYNILLPKDLIVGLINFIEENLNKKLMKIEALSNKNMKTLSKAKNDFWTTQEKFAQYMTGKATEEVDIEKIHEEPNIEMGIKKYFSLIKKSQIEEMGNITSEGRSRSPNRKIVREEENDLNSQFWRESMLFKRTKSKPLLTETKVVCNNTHNKFLYSNGGYPKLKSSRKSLSSFKKKKKESPRNNLRFSLRKNKQSEVILPRIEKDEKLMERSKSSLSFKKKEEKEKEKKIMKSKRKGSRRRIKRNKEELTFQEKTPERPKVARWERLYKIGVDKANREKDRTPKKSTDGFSKGIEFGELNQNKSQNKRKRSGSKRILRKSLRNQSKSSIPKQVKKKIQYNLKSKGTAQKSKKKFPKKERGKSKVKRIPAPKKKKEGKKREEKRESEKILVQELLTETDFLKKTSPIKPSPEIKGNSTYDRLNYTLDSNESDLTKQYFVGLLNHLNPPKTSRRSPEEEPFAPELILNIYKNPEEEKKIKKRRANRGFKFDSGSCAANSNQQNENLENRNENPKYKKQILQNIKITNRFPLQEIPMPGMKNQQKLAKGMINEMSLDKEFSENYCSNDFLSFKDNSLKSFEFVENGSICGERMRRENILPTSRVNTLSDDNLDLSTSRANYSSFSKSMQTNTIEEIRIDMELVDKSILLQTTEETRKIETKIGGKNENLTERGKFLTDRTNIFKQQEDLEEYSSDKMGQITEIRLKRKKSSYYKKPPTDSSRGNSQRTNRLDESNLLDKEGNLISSKTNKTYNTLEKEFLEMSLAEREAQNNAKVEENLKNLEINNMKEFLLASSESEKTLSRKESNTDFELAIGEELNDKKEKEGEDEIGKKQLVKNVSLG